MRLQYKQVNAKLKVIKFKGNQNPADKLRSVNAEKLKKNIGESLKKKNQMK